jgi:hypothetical protein
MRIGVFTYAIAVDENWARAVEGECHGQWVP